MNELERWVYLEEPVPPSIQWLLDSMRELEGPRPTAEERARAVAAVVERVDAELGGARATSPRGASPVTPVGFSRAPGSANEAGRLSRAKAALSFQEWAELAVRLLARSHEERLAALSARELALDEWAELDEHYREMLHAMAAGPPRPPGAAAGGVPAAPETLRVPVMPCRHGRPTLGQGDALETPVAVMPFTGSAGRAVGLQFPALTVRQYVSLRAELVGRPHRRAETLREFGVPSEASCRALDEHWHRELRARPELRAALHEAAATYLSWLAVLPR